ncbi:MAG: metallophosphoesterase [Microcoleaceae cyanobacterium]
MHRWLTGSLQVEKITVAIANLPPALNGIEIVQLSDLHYDYIRLSDQLLMKAIELTNEIKPDLIVLTGDFITHNPSPMQQLSQYLKHLQSRAGIYAVLGNHDYHYPESEAIVVKALTEIGIEVLINQVVYPFGEQLALVGLADLFSGKFKPESVMELVDKNIPRIVLSHNPDTAALLQPWRVDLQLSGHTHGGQIVFSKTGTLPEKLQKVQNQLPKPLKFLIPIKSDCKKMFRHWEWSAGLHQVGNNLLYTNRGLGTYFPGRWNCLPELTVIRLERA